MSWSVKSCQLCGTEQHSVGISRMVEQPFSKLILGSQNKTNTILWKAPTVKDMIILRKMSAILVGCFSYTGPKQPFANPIFLIEFILAPTKYLIPREDLLLKKYPCLLSLICHHDQHSSLSWGWVMSVTVQAYIWQILAGNKAICPHNTHNEKIIKLCLHGN